MSTPRKKIWLKLTKALERNDAVDRSSHSLLFFRNVWVEGVRHVKTRKWPLHSAYSPSLNLLWKYEKGQEGLTRSTQFFVTNKSTLPNLSGRDPFKNATSWNGGHLIVPAVLHETCDTDGFQTPRDANLQTSLAVVTFQSKANLQNLQSCQSL